MKKRKKFGLLKKTLSDLLKKAGISSPLEEVNKRIAWTATACAIVASGWSWFYVLSTADVSVWYGFTLMGAMGVLGIPLLMLIFWLAFLAYVDVRIYRRRVAVEAVLSDFLELTSANIRAGMPIDQALWQAIRPNFGVLAKEMEEASRKTMSGTDLEEALREFSHKYDSLLLKRSMSLLIEGLNAGGEIGELLDRIASNIQESRLMQREMSASVTTYAIFISIASVVASPFLLALSHQLLQVIEKIIGGVDLPESSGAFSLTFSQVGASPADFKIFALVTMTLTAFISACVVSTIKKGTIRAGFKYIPLFIIASILIFLVMDAVFGTLVQGLLI